MRCLALGRDSIYCVGKQVKNKRVTTDCEPYFERANRAAMPLLKQVLDYEEASGIKSGCHLDWQSSMQRWRMVRATALAKLLAVEGFRLVRIIPHNIAGGGCIGAPEGGVQSGTGGRGL